MGSFNDLPLEVQVLIAGSLLPPGMTLQIAPGGSWLKNAIGSVQFTQLAQLVHQNPNTEFQVNHTDGLMLEDDPVAFDLDKWNTFRAWHEEPVVHWAEGDPIPQATDFNRFRVVSRKCYMITDLVLRSLKVPIMLVCGGVPDFDLLTPIEQDVANASEVVHLRTGWSRFANIMPFLETLPNNKYILLPEREIMVDVDISRWNSAALQDGVDLGDEGAHDIIRTALHDLLPQDWQFSRPGRATRILSQVAVMNKRTTPTNLRLPHIITIIMALDITYPTSRNEQTADNPHPFVLATKCQIGRDLSAFDTRADILSLSRRYEELRRGDPTRRPAEITALVNNNRNVSRNAAEHWQQWLSRSEPGQAQSFKQSSTWKCVSHMQPCL